MEKRFLGPNNEILLEANFDIDRVVIFLPGVSGQAHSRRFAPLAKISEETGYACARLKIWDDSEELENFSFKDIFSKLDELIEILKKQGFVDVVLVGKSFGGGVALLYNNDLITQKILWAPAIGVTVGEGNFVDYIDTKLIEIDNPLDITVDKEQLKGLNIPINIIHGDVDNIIPLHNSEQIVALCGGTLEVISEAGHSFKEPAHEKALYEATKKFLN